MASTDDGLVADWLPNNPVLMLFQLLLRWCFSPPSSKFHAGRDDGEEENSFPEHQNFRPLRTQYNNQARQRAGGCEGAGIETGFGIEMVSARNNIVAVSGVKSKY